MSNKGAVGISFNFLENRLCFITSHLAAHQDKILERNANYFDIVKGLKVTRPPLDITNSFHYLFWFGDLNYRIDMNRDKVIELIKQKDWESLHQVDQLDRENKSHSAFIGFQEGKINFSPTYRFIRGSKIYNDEKQRIPSWCDRVLWKTLPQCPALVQTSYNSSDQIMTSDHSPVYSTFNIPIMHHSSFENNSTCSLKFLDLRAEIFKRIEKKWLCDSVIVVHSPFILVDPVTTSVQTKTLTPIWEAHQIPPVFLTSSNKDYIQHQHIYLRLRDHNRDQDIGMSIVSLAPLCRDGDVHVFQAELTYKGEIKGRLQGKVKLEITQEELSEDSNGLSFHTASPAALVNGGTAAIGSGSPYYFNNISGSGFLHGKSKQRERAKRFKSKSLTRASWNGDTSRKALSSHIASNDQFSGPSIPVQSSVSPPPSDNLEVPTFCNQETEKEKGKDKDKEKEHQIQQSTKKGPMPPLTLSVLPNQSQSPPSSNSSPSKSPYSTEPFITITTDPTSCTSTTTTTTTTTTNSHIVTSTTWISTTHTNSGGTEVNTPPLLIRPRYKSHSSSAANLLPGVYSPAQTSSLCPASASVEEYRFNSKPRQKISIPSVFSTPPAPHQEVGPGTFKKMKSMTNVETKRSSWRHASGDKNQTTSISSSSSSNSVSKSILSHTRPSHPN
eukprot:TRINITY_DN1696_c0_g1_i1.p1 TRINITY_DN1696_c0_g1~~TRINITY_DN1696_c0_g1_i1.p1  ORF type:complete len:669 (+),score=118.43 TRINITY_DN1696_c0_g1_i1:1842-3848(+)